MSNTAEKAEQQAGNWIKERPILFSAPMVRAILDGRKTQTRRVVKPQPAGEWAAPGKTACPYGQPGDRLWVRETWKPDVDGDTSCTTYKADGAKIHIENSMASAERWLAVRRSDEQWPTLKEPAWRPSIHMPRWASRIDLEITGVRVERLQEISEDDAIAEGIERVGGDTSATPWRNYDTPKDAVFACNCSAPSASYRTLWESINGPGSWDLNLWVWVVEFRRV